MFTWHSDNCAAVYCSAVPLFKHDCIFGWCLWVLSSVIIALFLTMITLCAITRRHLAAIKPSKISVQSLLFDATQCPIILCGGALILFVTVTCRVPSYSGTNSVRGDTHQLRPDRGLEIRRLPIQVAERPGNNTGFMFARSEMHDTTAAAVMPGTGHSTASERSTTRFPRGGPGVYGSVRLKEFYF